jgi:hypothetical protein
MAGVLMWLRLRVSWGHGSLPARLEGGIGLDSERLDNVSLIDQSWEGRYGVGLGEGMLGTSRSDTSSLQG